MLGMGGDADRMVPNPAPWWGADKKQPQFYQGLRMKTDTNLHEQLDAMIARVLPAGAVSGRKPKVLDHGRNAREEQTCGSADARS